MVELNNYLSADEISLYEEIFRCESCSHLKDPDGVYPFASRDAQDGQTIPVSHFGNIKSALIWLILTNPKGNRQDSNVGLQVRQFSENRTMINQDHILKIFKHFSDYDFRTSSPEFWLSWRKLLNDIRINEHQVSFESGGICAVDLIKCPTKAAWGSFVRTIEGKEVWAKCNCRNKNNIGHLFLNRQIHLHKPLILILPGTTLYGPGNIKTYLGIDNPSLKNLIKGPANYIKNIRTLKTPKRLAIELGAMGDIKKIIYDVELLASSRSIIQNIISEWINKF